MIILGSEIPPRILVQAKALIPEKYTHPFVQTLRIVPIIQGPLYIDIKIPALG